MQNNTNQMTDKSTPKSSNGKWAQVQKGSDIDVAGVTESARKIYDQAVETGADFISTANKRATEMVREYPVYATLGGLCIGLILGASLFGRSQRAG